MFYTDELHPFRAFQLSHFAILSVIIIVCGLFWYFSNHIKSKQTWRYIRYSLAFSMIIMEGILILYRYKHGILQLKHDLPIELCSVSLWMSVIMLLTNSHRLYRILVFTGIVGASLALIRPVLHFNFPHFRFFNFFFQHGAIILSVLIMKKSENPPLYVRDIWITLGLLNVLMFVCYTVNKHVGSNYFFVSKKPAVASPLDYLGGYPYYLISCEFVALGLFYLVFALFRKKKTKE